MCVCVGDSQQLLCGSAISVINAVKRLVAGGASNKMASLSWGNQFVFVRLKIRTPQCFFKEREVCDAGVVKDQIHKTTDECTVSTVKSLVILSYT